MRKKYKTAKDASKYIIFWLQKNIGAIFPKLLGRKTTITVQGAVSIELSLIWNFTTDSERDICFLMIYSIENNHIVSHY